MLKYDVGIVNYNGGEVLWDCVKSILDQEIPPQNIYIANNSIDDSTPIKIEHQHPQIRVVQRENDGYAGACNHLMELFESEWFLLCNMDLKFPRAWSQHIHKAITDNPLTHSFASSILLEETPIRYNAASIGFKADLYPYSPEDGEIHSALTGYEEIFGPYGAVIFINQTFRKTVGLMEASYFLFFEETEYFFRAQLLGMKTTLVKEATVFHHRSLATERYSLTKLYYPERNRVRTIVKFFPMSFILSSFFKSPLRLIWQQKRLKRIRANAPKAPNQSATPMPHTFTILLTLCKAWLHGLFSKASWRKRKKWKQYQTKSINILENYRA